MQPQLDHFLQRYQDHQNDLANQPTDDEKFEIEQFQSVVKAVGQATKDLVRFLTKAELQVGNFPTEFNTPDVVDALKKLETSLKPANNSDVVKGLKSLQDGLEKQLKEIPVSDNVAVSNLDEITKRFTQDIASVVKAIEKQNLSPEIKVAAPKVTVQPTPVQVQATDVKGLIKAMKDVKVAVDVKPIPVANTPTDPLILYAEADIDDVDGTNTLKTVRYYGYTDNRGAWYIKKMDTSGIGSTGKSIRFAFGQANYSTNWTNRASLTYTAWGS